MGWKAYRLVYQAKSPIHIGWHTLGYIKLTRYYITGRNMWGAMTANIVRTLYGHDDYHGVGELLKKNILISYFYPAIDDFRNPLLPNFQNDGLHYGGYPVSDFERLFIRSYGQTAVLPESNTAEDQSLHESDFISHYVEEENTKKRRNVYFVGYIFIHNNAHYKGALTLEKIESAVTEIFVGGDRKYGWGRLSLETGKKDEAEDNKVFGHQLDTQKDSLQITILENKGIPAHLELKAEGNIKIKGDIEPLLGLEWGTSSKIGAGQKISEAKICWMPGSVIENKITLKIGEFGILTA